MILTFWDFSESENNIQGYNTMGDKTHINDVIINEVFFTFSDKLQVIMQIKCYVIVILW